MKKNYLPKTLAKFIWYFVKKQKPYFIIIQTTALAWSVDNTAWPFFLKMLIDKITVFTPGQGNIWHYLMPILFFAASIWISIEIAFRISGFMMASVFPKFEAQIRMHMFEYVQDHSYSYFANHLQETFPIELTI